MGQLPWLLTKGMAMRRKASKTYIETLQVYVGEYEHESGRHRYTIKELVAWAMATGRWEPPHDLAARKCREDFARALREDYITNDRGQPVRAKHPARVRVADG